MLQETPWDENISIQETPQETIGETSCDKGSSMAPPQHAKGMEYWPPSESLTQDKLFQLLMGLQSQNQTNEWVITIANQDESKLPSPPKPKPYKGGNYQAYYNFCYQLDQYIKQKPQAFYNKEQKITYGQRWLEGPIAASWTQHQLSVDMEAYTLKEFKQYCWMKSPHGGTTCKTPCPACWPTQDKIVRCLRERQEGVSFSVV